MDIDGTNPECLRGEENFAPQPPRGWHHEFAHNALRTIAFEQTDKLLSALANPERIDKVPAAVMRCVAQNLGVNDTVLAEFAETIRVYARLSGILPVYVFEMPPPETSSEAHFVAVVNFFTGTPRIRYYTLENTPSGGTELLTWNDAGEHHDLGESPPPNIQSFLGAITNHLVTATDYVSTDRNPVTTLHECITRNNASPGNILDILNAALIDASIVSEDRVRVSEDGLNLLVTVKPQGADFICLSAWWRFDARLTLEQRLEVTNRINTRYYWIKANVDSDHMLQFSLDISLQGSITRQQLVGTIRRFLQCCTAAAREHLQNLG